MYLFYAVHDLVARIGLDVAVITCLTVMMTGIRLAFYASNRPLASFSRTVVTWTPLGFALLFALRGASQTWAICSLLHQQAAITTEQMLLIIRSSAWGILKCLTCGIIATLWLYQFGRFTRRSSEALSSKESGVPTS